MNYCMAETGLLQPMLHVSIRTQIAVHNISSFYFRSDHPFDCSKKSQRVAKRCQGNFLLLAHFLSLITPAVTFANTLCPPQLSHILQTPKKPQTLPQLLTSASFTDTDKLKDKGMI